MAWPKPACPVCLVRSWQHPPARLGLVPPATRGLVLIASTSLGSLNPLLAKREVLGLCSFEQVVKKKWLFGTDGHLVSTPALLAAFRGWSCVDLSKAASVTRWDKRKVGIAPHCWGSRAAVLSLADEGWGLAPLEFLQFETSNTETRLHLGVGKPSGNHRQLPSKGVRPSSLRHLLNLALFSGICHPFLDSSFFLTYL